MNDSNPDEVTVDPDGNPISQVDSPDPDHIGRYRIERRLGRGGFGLVFLAYDEHLERNVAVKVPHANLISGPEDVQGYLAEARAVASLDHPGIVPVHDVGTAPDCPFFIVSKYIKGTDLRTTLKQQRLRYSEAAELIATVAEALHYAHKQGLVHRDVKPGNILIDGAGEPYVVDFGLALREDNIGTGPWCAGTPAYMSPEQARGEGHRVDGRSDIFSLGVVFYELLAGRRPFRGDTQTEILERVTRYEPRPLRQYDEKMPKELERICHKALAKRASERYSSAHDMAEDLRVFLADETAVPSGTATGGFAPGDSGTHSTPNSTSSASNSRLMNSDSATSESIALVSVAGSPPIKVVPRGLRSFDAHDADFFLELLPGPRDRAGLPDSVQFWKTRIEESDPDKTFSVGLIYGPSGCGKSSLVKAGLLPRLSEDIISVYIEATPEETETRLLRGLRKSCPALDEHLNLHGTLAALRRGQGIPVGRKVLIVLDQFEQWLHAKKDEHDTELVRALRQCDGGRVQCVLLVRDDFWLAVSRLLRDLEVPLVEGHNIALADLFDIDHAQKVLAAFGRAFGKLPDDVGETTKENKEFLKRSVAGLAQEGKVICVRLALFADMMKGRAWTPAALKEVGGTTGVGVTFLEETFASASASPQHRLHQQAARSVLQDLLPGSGLDIKGHMRSRSDLLAVSGYEHRSADFEELIRILDSEIRLITPTDPEGLDSDSATETESGKKYFQLAHDYLVPSLRDWLTRKQKETYRGRAELRLTERATLWNARPENRRLPAWWEYLSIVGLTRRQNWSEPERAMMQKAGQFHGLRGVIGLTVAALLMFGGLRLRQNIQQGQEAVRQESIQKERTVRAEELVRGLVYADIGRIDDIILQLEPYQDLAQPLLQEQWDAAEDGGPQKLNLSLGLLSDDPGQVAYLTQQLLRAHPEEFPVIRDALTEHAGPLATALWDELDAHDDSANGDSDRQLRAAAALATWDSSNPQWELITDAVAAQLCAVPVSFLRDWKEACRPVYPRLLEPLTEIYRDVEQDELARSMAASLLADYAGKDPERLAGLISIANRKQFDVIYPVISKLGDEAVQKLTAIIEQEIRPGWNDVAADPKWSLVPKAAADAFESAGGLLTEQYAFCMTMKWLQCLDIAETLRSSGYRPVRFRPYAIRDELQVAATWIRDGQDWQIHSDLTDEQLRTKDSELRKANFAPIDVAGYVVRDSEGADANRFAAIWGPADDSEVRMYSGTPADAERMLFADSWAADGFDVRTRSAFTSNGTTYRSAIWTKRGDHKTSASKLFSGDHSQFSGDIYPGLLLTDISVEQSTEPLDRQQQYRQRLGLLEEVLPERKDEVVFRKALATVRFQLGKDEEALADLDWLIEQSPDDVRLVQLRSMLHARGQDADAARQDLTRCRELYKDDVHYLYLEVVVDAYLGDDVAAIKKLEEQIASDPENGVLLYNATCAFALLADMFTAKDEEKSEQFLQRGLALLEQTIAAGYDNFDHMRQDSDLDALRGDPKFQTLLQIDHAELKYTAAWNPNPNFESQELHGLSLEAHSRRFRQLIIDGYRPVAVSAMASPTDNALAAASIWMRPRASYAVKEGLNRKKAQAAAALLRMNAAGPVWPLLAHSTEPGARSYLIHGLTPFTVKPQIIIDRLSEETDVSTRRALLLALGEFDYQRWPAAEQKKLTDELLTTFVEDPDAGIHAAAEWVLRRWGQVEELTKRTRDFATGEPQGDRQWYVTGQEQTVVLIPGPIEFLMGSPVDEVGREDQLRGHFEELHPQGIERSFAIMSHEITVDQYLKWKPDFDYNEKFAREGGAPMTRISWFEAAEYCNWLSEQEGIPEDQWCYRPNESGKYAQGMSAVADFLQRTGYRLPTEAEWEYACGAGALTSRYFGDTEDLLGEYVWCSRHSKDRWMLPVGSLKPNDFGLFDMLGNAWEWCNDESRYFLIPTSGEARKDLPVIKNVLDTQRQCMRGGSFLAQPAEARTSRRFRYTPTFHNYSVGMRVARTIP